LGINYFNRKLLHIIIILNYVVQLASFILYLFISLFINISNFEDFEEMSSLLVGLLVLVNHQLLLYFLLVVASFDLQWVFVNEREQYFFLEEYRHLKLKQYWV
jgi:hypothetical protein